MTNENIFKEIEEDLERQRYEELWRKYGPFVVALAMAIVAGTAGYNFWQGHTQQEHQKATGELASIAAAKVEPARQVSDLADFAIRHKGKTQATFAELQAAQLAAKQGKNDQALTIYNEIAKDAQADHAFRQLADLLAVKIQLDSSDPAALQERLKPLLGEKEPWRYSAMEYSAFLALRSGDKAKAKEVLTFLSQNADVPNSISARANDMLGSLAR